MVSQKFFSTSLANLASCSRVPPGGGVGGGLGDGAIGGEDGLGLGGGGGGFAMPLLAICLEHIFATLRSSRTVLNCVFVCSLFVVWILNASAPLSTSGYG